MTSLSNNAIARAIYLARKDKIPSKQIVEFLAQKRLLGRAPEILSELRKIVNQATGVLEAKISSAKNLKGETKKELEHVLAKHYGAQHIILEEKIDEKLLGGFRVEVADEILDLTFKNKIEKLGGYLTREA
jgi:ATP synthase F1 delta subunit